MKNGKWGKALFWVAFLVANILFIYVLRTTQAGRDVTAVLFGQRPNPALTRPTDTRLERAFHELKYGMTEAEVRAIVKKHVDDPPGPNSRGMSHASDEVHDSRMIGGDLPKEGVPLRTVMWNGPAIDGEGQNYYAAVLRPTELRTEFDADDKLYYATYRCKVELRFPHEDLQLTKDGVYPFNHAFPK